MPLHFFFAPELLERSLAKAVTQARDDGTSPSPSAVTLQRNVELPVSHAPRRSLPTHRETAKHIAATYPAAVTVALAGDETLSCHFMAFRRPSRVL
jgi:hypothetical protein